jgi:type II secretory pathway pseudopilin PulG
VRAACRIRSGFSLMEAIIAVSITALAGSVLLLAVESSLTTTTDATERALAEGLAEQLLEEIVTRRFAEPGTDPVSGTLGRDSGETSATQRLQFDDTDDYHGYAAQPPQDFGGKELGQGDDQGNLRHPNFRLSTSALANWRQEVAVYFVDPANPTQRLASSTSAYRAVEVTIQHVERDGSRRPLAQRRRVYVYLPPTP